MTPIDIRPADLETVRLILRERVPAVEVRAFGSRMAWNARETSDLDLALMTDEPLTVAQMADLRAAFTDADLPFRVDIVDWASTSEAFRRVVEAEHAVLIDGSGGHYWDARPVRSIEDVCFRVTSGGTPSRRRPSFYEDGCWPWLKTQELRDGWLDDSEEHITDDAVASSSARVLPENTVLMAMYGATVGQLGILRRPMTCNQACCAMIVDPGQADYRYLFYQLLHARPRIRDLSTGAAQQNLSGQLIKSLKFPFPALSEQQSIAHILGTLDDKIELNRRMNATLEAMARALFRSWFVDFDPVRAKMEGRDTGLPKDIADLFPDRLVDSELGEIPEGWDIGSLAEYFEAVRGVSYKGSGLGRGGIPMHNLNSVHEGGGYKYDGIKFYVGDYADRHHVRPGDVIIANTEQGHDRLLIGYAAIVPSFFGDHGICSHHVYRLRPRRNGHLSTSFLHLLLNSPWMHDLVSGYANGTTVNMLPVDAVQKPMVSAPPRTLIEIFDALALDMEHRREQAVRESLTLGVIRDALLPKLVSGELRVGDGRRLAANIAPVEDDTETVPTRYGGAPNEDDPSASGVVT